jgi:acyl-CoA thioester hydrolase
VGLLLAILRGAGKGARPGHGRGSGSHGLDCGGGDRLQHVDYLENLTLTDAAPADARQAIPRLEDFPHTTTITMRLGDHDHQNHVNNVVYGVYFESSRVLMMRETLKGVDFGNTGFVVGRLEINFVRELHWPGDIVAACGVERIGNRSVSYAQAVFHKGECAAYGRTTMVLIDQSTRRSTALPAPIVERFKTMLLR